MSFPPQIGVKGMLQREASGLGAGPFVRVHVFDSLLIANRGEIAVRIARTARGRGLRTIAVYSDADRNALHVRACDRAIAIGGERAADSYLRIDKLIDATRASGAQALHPGYGFLSENPALARACVDAGLVFIGPPASAMEAMSDKAAARQLAVQLGIPVLPGYEGPEDGLQGAAERIGYPVMIKAARGGGGRGMRAVNSSSELPAALQSARSEAQAAFGDGSLILERALLAPRHVEMQVFADVHGNVIYLGERDCSVQRRHQKIVEEAPCPVLTPKLRRALGEAAAKLARAIGYVGAGTVEFLLDGGDFYFMEMNTRLQVEHPVTEEVLGIDLVDWQLRIAAGEPLPFAQGDVQIRLDRAGCCAIEVRLCAEDAANDFLPASGEIICVRLPQEYGAELRIDHALDADSGEVQIISPFYDSLLGKLITRAPTRHAAARALAAALDRTVVFGVKTNRAFLGRVLRHPAFLAGDATTAFIAQHFADNGARAVALSDALWAIAAFISTRFNATPFPPEWRGWSSSGVVFSTFCLACEGDERRGRVEGSGRNATVRWGECKVELLADGLLAEREWTALAVDGRRTEFIFVRTGAALWLQVDRVDACIRDLRLAAPAGTAATASAGSVVAPMHGRVVRLHATAGRRVERGAALATLEAMKMEHTLTAPGAGIVRAVNLAAGDQVAPGRVLFEIEIEK